MNKKELNKLEIIENYIFSEEWGDISG